MRTNSLPTRIAVTALVLGLLALRGWHIVTTEALARDGAEARAVVLGIRHRPGPPVFRTKPYIEYHYRAGGNLLKGSVSVPETEWNALAEGATIAVRYDRANAWRHVALPYGLEDLHDWKKYALLLSLAAVALAWTWRGFRR